MEKDFAAIRSRILLQNRRQADQAGRPQPQPNPNPNEQIVTVQARR